MSTEDHEWQSCLERALTPGSAIDRVRVVDVAPSTQDAARTLSGGTPGLMLIARRQTAGRGRLGRAWFDKHGLGLAATFVLDASTTDDALALRTGLAACTTVEACLGVRASDAGVRWPNDVVERATDRKIAGVLVERSGPLALVGIGINVGHTELDWPPDLAGRSISLHAMGSSTPREGVSIELLGALDRWLDAPTASVVAAWKSRDILLGTRRAFVHNARHYAGRVLDLSPLDEITLETSEGVVKLPAATTSLVHRVL